MYIDEDIVIFNIRFASIVTRKSIIVTPKPKARVNFTIPRKMKGTSKAIVIVQIFKVCFTN